MEYEIVKLDEKTVAGLAAKTNNAAPDMQAVIGGLWEKLYHPGVYDAVGGKTNGYALGLYTDYAGTEKEDYTAVVGCEVSSGAQLPAGMVLKTIPAGRYAVFTVQGNVQTAVSAFWQELWSMKELPRSFICDFEEYRNCDMEHADIRVYIGLKEI